MWAELGPTALRGHAGTVAVPGAGAGAGERSILCHWGKIKVVDATGIVPAHTHTCTQLSPSHKAMSRTGVFTCSHASHPLLCAKVIQEGKGLEVGLGVAQWIRAGRLRGQFPAFDGVWPCWPQTSKPELSPGALCS